MSIWRWASIGISTLGKLDCGRLLECVLGTLTQNFPDKFWKSTSAEGRLETFEDKSEESKKINLPHLKSFSNEEELNNKEIIKGIDLQIFCFGNGKTFQLGSCSSTFLKCLDFNNNNNKQQRFIFEECPLGKVFIGKGCKFFYY